VQIVLAHQIFESARGCDHDVNAVTQSLYLTVLRDTAEDCGDSQVIRLSEWLHCVRNLGCQLAGRCKHKTEWSASPTLAAGKVTGEASDHGDAEREGLARAGFSATEHISSSECVRQRVYLDRKGGVNARSEQGRNEWRRNAEFGEREFRHANTFSLVLARDRAAALTSNAMSAGLVVEAENGEDVE
jgi:hypothetical protein